MSVDDLVAELDQERTWRVQEVKQLKNAASSGPDTVASSIRRSAIVMLYAHFEGFCKFALLAYVRSINAAALTCVDATETAVAAAWREVFNDLSNSGRRAVLRPTLPEDISLHSLARQAEFVRRVRLLLEMQVKIDDRIVNTESNLTPLVLKKNLFSLGLDYELVDMWGRELSTLLDMRNKIAHGATAAGVTFEQFERVETAAYTLMQHVQDVVVEAARSKAYRRAV